MGRGVPQDFAKFLPGEYHVTLLARAIPTDITSVVPVSGRYAIWFRVKGRELYAKAQT